MDDQVALRPPQGGDVSRCGVRFWIVAGILAYCILLRQAYTGTISELFAYRGYTYRPSPLWSELLSVSLAVTPSIWLPRELRRPSGVLVWVVFLLAYVPSVLVPQWNARLSPWDVATLSVSLFVAMIILGFSGVPRLLSIPESIVPSWLAWVVLIVVSGVLYGVLIAEFGVRVHLPSLTEVYETRSDYKAAVAAAGPAVAYSLLWLGKVLNPLLMSLGVLRRNAMLFAAGCVGQAMLYAAGGQKAQLLSPILLLAIAFASGWHGRRLGVILALGAPMMVAGAMLADAMSGLRIFTSLLVRRLVITPGLLSGLYFEYFGDHPKTMRAFGSLGGLVEYPYFESSPELIGKLFLKAGTYANANLWADGYGAFGIPGLIGVTVILAIFLWIYDSVAGLHRVRFAALLIAFPAFALANTALLTTLVSHGLLLVVMVMALLPPSISNGARGEAADGVQCGTP